MLQARVVKTEIDGLDLVLGGGVRVLERVDGAGDSATILVRGAAGTGKTLVANHIAASLAKKMECDVAVACIELLPPELEAQLAGFEVTRPLLPVRGNERVIGATPRVFARVIEPDLSKKNDPLGDAVQGLLDGIEQNGGVPRVLIVDSLSDGYGIGGKVERVAADALARLAAVRGLCLILIEEVQQLRPSPWCFAVDTVIELRLERLAGSVREERTLTVTKNRFGPSDAGPHELAFGGSQLMVLPEPEAWDRAWAGGWWTLPVKRAEGERNWAYSNLDEQVKRGNLSKFEDSITLVRAPDPLSAMKLAESLGLRGKSDGAIVRFAMRGGGLFVRGPAYGDAFASGHRWQSLLVEFMTNREKPIEHVVIGDLSTLSQTPQGPALLRAVARTVLWLDVMKIPVVLYETAASRIKGRAVGTIEHDAYETVEGGAFTPRFGENVIVEAIPKVARAHSKMPTPEHELLVSDLELRAQFVL